MKRIIITLAALALAASPAAHAEKWAEMPNQAGGKILLLPDSCDDGRGRMVIATSSEGNSANGCWFLFADMIHIVWRGGKTSSFNPADFTMREKK